MPTFSFHSDSESEPEYDSEPESDGIDSITPLPLPDALIISILSFLPTRIAARTSLLSRRFRYLWEGSPCLRLISRDLPPPKSHNFAAMVNSTLFRRNPAYPVHSLLLDVAGYNQPDSFVQTLVAKAASLGLRHLVVECCTSVDLVSSIPVMFSIGTLESLTVQPILSPVFPFETFVFPSGMGLVRLTTLSLCLMDVDVVGLNRLISELGCLEDLHLQLYGKDGFTINSRSITKLNLIIVLGSTNFDNVELSIPSLEVLCLEIHGSVYCLPNIHGEIPSPRKAVINLNDLRKRDVGAVAGLLSWVSHVQELCLEISESEDETFPFPILLEPGKDPPKFSNLKHLNVTMCFHKHNFGAIATLLCHSPALESLKLLHKVPKFSYMARQRSRKGWASMLPCNVIDYRGYVYFRNLHLGQHSEELKLIKLQGENVPLGSKPHH